MKRKRLALPDEDVDDDVLETKMLSLIAREKQAIKNWHKVTTRITMVKAFSSHIHVQKKEILCTQKMSIPELKWW